MSSAMGIIFLIINGVIGFFKREKAIMIYMFLGIVAPVTQVFGAKISYELLFFVPILFFFMLKKSKRFNIESKYLMAYICVFTISSLISNLLYTPQNLWLYFFGIIRMCILFIIFVNSSNFRDHFKKILAYSLYINAVVMFFQLTVPSSVKIFYDLYSKDYATAMLGSYQRGYYSRLYGTFDNIAPAAFFFLVVVAFYLDEYEKNNSLKNVLIIILSITCGLATASNTFLVGLPVIFLVNYIIKTFLTRKDNYRKNIFAKPLLAVLLVLSVYFFLNYIDGLLHTSIMIERLSSDNIFSTRYQQGSGNLTSAIQVIKQNWLLGIGSTRVMGEFVGDSLYVSIMHGTGAIGLLLVISLLLRLIKISIRNHNKQNILLLVSVLAVGVAVPTIFDFLGIMVLAYVVKSNSIERE
jgi:hypothetical protein